VSRGGVIHSFLVTGVQQVRKEIVLPFTQARETHSPEVAYQVFRNQLFISQLDDLVAENRIDHLRVKCSFSIKYENRRAETYWLMSLAFVQSGVRHEIF
jgi:hypothetical protein